MMKKYVSVVLAVLAVSGCQQRDEKKDPPAVRVGMETVSLGTDYSVNPYVGQVEEQSSTAVSFTMGGTVRRVYVEEGQRVKQGQLIAELDETSAHNSLHSAEAVLTQARDVYERMKMLHEEQTLPDVQWVEAQSKLAQAQSAFEQAKKNLGDCRLSAPVSGIVGTKMVDAGETALPGSPVVTLLDISSVKVKVSVPEKEISGITADAAATIEVAALGGDTFHGGRIVKHVASDAMTHSYGIQIHLQNPSGRLLPGMVCNVRFQQTSEPQITVPVTAVQRGRGHSLYVWKIKDGTAHQQTVTTGATYGSRMVIADGLTEGDTIVTSGWQKLSEGTKTTVR